MSGTTIGFTGGRLDRADRLRHDPEALAAALSGARMLLLDGLTPQVTGEGLLAWGDYADAPPGAEPVLLGMDGGRAHVAALLPASGRGDVPAIRSPALMAVLSGLQPGEAATYAAARSLLDWHARHGFCANCGQATAPFRAGWGRRCAACGTEHFPRVDPVVIMIAEHDGRALLGRGKGWPEGRYSALAGFVEPAEAIEEAVAREIAEEAGVHVTGVRYIASQPWPFPSQLMIACIATADSDTLTVDTNELEDAMWVTRDEVRAVLAGEPGPFLAPPPYAIARTLLGVWAG
ncbi:NAD(+) diphosphatase [Sphingomonas sp. KR1UV-12]|uniref:NAD(+) diphosphatase n=1 Tax=Sphingomonas aurea TaxID=3063994 RepID=A0ABT9EJZ1_9SPHN|nr:NAD(+) diphosphatase [Sphingomonas sp. KR1UV-12]MDP1027295.1 NAD(+) diphosphatase [Sphingomonas sp. KR1UV-12]